jgi:endonuclease YncB( thermonuclease family)
MRRAVALCILVSSTLPTAADAIELCKGSNRKERKVSCLVDGDTGWEQGIKWRLRGIDTPEYLANAECEQEPEFAKIATYRMLELMSAGYSIEWLGIDDGSRELVQIRLMDGRDAGAILLSEGHAVQWPHVSGVWCR